MSLGLTVDRAPRRKSTGSYSFLSEFKYRTQRRETILRSTRMNYGGKHLLTVGSSRDDRELVQTIQAWTVPDGARSQLRNSVRMINFLPRIFPELAQRETRSADVREALERLDKIRRLESEAFEALASTLNGIEYVAAMRQPPERTYVNTGVAGANVGADGSNWPGILAIESGRRSSRGRRLQNWIRQSGLAADIEVAWLTDRHYEILVTHPVSRERANVADVGQGTSQVLPVIVGGSRLDPGSVFIVEEPEIHLHPRAQAALGDFFVDLALDRVQSLVETHSEYLILRVQQRIACGDISADDVVFYYVSSGSGGKQIQSLHLDSNAAFRDQIAGGFFPQRIDEAKKLALARSARTTLGSS